MSQLPRPGTKWRQWRADADAAVYRDQLEASGAWPWPKWVGVIDRYAHLDRGLSAWFKEMDGANTATLLPPTGLLESLLRFEQQRPVIRHEPPVLLVSPRHYEILRRDLMVSGVNLDTKTITIAAPRLIAPPVAPKSRRPAFLPVARLDGRKR